MAEVRDRRGTHARGGRRVYATPNNFETEAQTPEWQTRTSTWKTGKRNDEEIRRDGVQSRPWNDSSQQGPENDANIQHADSEGSLYQKEDDDADVRRAAALLLDRASNILFADLCDGCSASFKCRLASIASGITGLSAVADLSHIDADHSGDGESTSLCHEVEKKDRKVEISLRHEPNNRRMGSVMTGDSNGTTASNIINSALRSVRDAPAYRTRAMSRQAGLLQTPDQVSSEFHGNQQCLMEVRRKDFCYFDWVNGQKINILEGLELHMNVLNSTEQKELIDFVLELQELGRNQKLRRRTYSEPRKWMRGKGRITLQFGCCYNYAVDKVGNPPGIIREEEVDEIPHKFRMVIKRLVEWHVLPSSCIPDSCIVNIYDIGDCIPPHIDHHDFVRPFCTLSLLSECNIIFGTNLKIAGPGEFVGSCSIPLPTGSVLILNGNGADIAKHAVPAVPTKRISITFRKMDPNKVPVSFRPDKELLSTKPLPDAGNPKSSTANSSLNSVGGSAKPLTDAGHPKLSVTKSSSNSVDGSNFQGRNSDAPQFSLESDFPALRINHTPGRPALDGRFRNLRT